MARKAIHFVSQGLIVAVSMLRQAGKAIWETCTAQRKKEKIEMWNRKSCRAGRMDLAKRAAVLEAIEMVLNMIEGGLADSNWDAIRMAKGDCVYALHVASNLLTEPTLEESLAALTLDDNPSESTQSAGSTSEEASHERRAKRQRLR